MLPVSPKHIGSTLDVVTEMAIGASMTTSLVPVQPKRSSHSKLYVPTLKFSNEINVSPCAVSPGLGGVVLLTGLPLLSLSTYE